MQISRLLRRDRLKPLVRRISWVANQLFWNQIFPVASGITSKVVVDAIQKHVLPRTNSPFITGHLLQVQTIDGAVIAGLMPKRAWAKYAVPKGLPKNGERTLAIENDPHMVDDFDGEIKQGYGQGRKSLIFSGPIATKVQGRVAIGRANIHFHEADKAGPHWDVVVEGIKPGTKQWEMNIPNGPLKGRYAFVTTDRGMLITRMKDQGLVMAKPDYTLRQEDRLTTLDPTKVIVERKVDGSLGNAHIQGQRVAFRSHREGGETYYDRLPAIEFLRNESSFALGRLVYPGPQLTGTVFQGELAHPDGAARVSGILNSLPANARAIQLQRGPVRYFVWDVLKYRGKDVSKYPYWQRREICENAVAEISQVNKGWDIVERATNETPLSFYKRVTSDPLPWGEGIVVKPIDGVLQKWDKLKMTGFGYFKLVKVLPGEGKYERSVGRLVVENPSNGAVGEVGSLAVPDEYRNWIWKHREDLLGETIKVRSQEVTTRGVPRAGVFYGLHNGIADLLMAAEAGAASTDKTPKQVMYAMKSAAGWRKQ